MPRIPSIKLLLVVALIWLLAGGNIMAIGIAQSIEWHDWWVFVFALAVCSLFTLVVFPPVIKRYTRRIADIITERSPVWQAFNAQGYLIIVVMMSAGFALRLSGAVPGWFISLFYLGLGAALILAALAFLHNYGAITWRRANPQTPSPHHRKA